MPKLIHSDVEYEIIDNTYHCIYTKYTENSKKKYQLFFTRELTHDSHIDLDVIFKCISLSDVSSGLDVDYIYYMLRNMPIDEDYDYIPDEQEILCISGIDIYKLKYFDINEDLCLEINYKTNQDGYVELNNSTKPSVIFPLMNRTDYYIESRLVAQNESELLEYMKFKNIE